MTLTRWCLASRLLAGLAFCVLAVSIAWAFPTYDDCEECHGGFHNFENYTSLQDGTAWGTDLMFGHLTYIDGVCEACHKAVPNEVFLNQSAHASLNKACVGCHGRDEDVTGNCTGLAGELGGVEAECGSGAGLRRYHESNVGAGTCSGCHDGDAVPVGEHIAPYNYGRQGIAVQDPCDADGTESRFGPTGLDNDGDGQRDGEDSDCQPNARPTRPGALSATDVTAGSAIVHWGASLDDDGDAISYQVDYRRNGEVDWSDGGNTGDTAFQLDDLDAEQSYDVQVTANDGTEDSVARMKDNLFQTLAAGALFEINAGVSDAWFNGATPGQGFLIVVFPEQGIIFLAWFTYDTERPPEDVLALLGEAGHRWLTAQGPYAGDTAELTVYLTEGGVFDSAEPPAVTDVDHPLGTITIVWHDCEHATLTYDIDPPGVSGEIELRRIVPDNVALCEALGEQ